MRDIPIALLLVGLVMVVHIGMAGLVPSGADGGNWLAIAEERLGVDVMAAKVAYPPLIPLILALGIPAVGAVPSLMVVALLAKSFLVLAVYVCCRPLGLWYALGSAVCCGLAGAQLEAYAWGGYPQLMGTAFALLTVYLGVRWLDDRRRWLLALTFFFGALTFGTHALMAGLLVVAFPLAVVHWLLVTRATKSEWRSASLLVAAVVIPGGLFVMATTISGSEAGVTAVLNPYEVSLLESVWLMIRDAVVPWIVVGVLGLAGLAVRKMNGPVAATLTLGSSWAAAGSAFFLATGEARALLLTQIGFMILACLAVHRALHAIGRRRAEERPMSRLARLAFPVVVTLVISMVSAIIAGGLVAYSASTIWYRVASEEVLEALDWLSLNSGPGDLTVTSAGPNGNPLGWWVQGYGRRQTFTGIDERALSFPDERAQAEIANRIFDSSTSETEVQSLLDSNGVDFLIVDRRGANAGWLDTSLAASFDTLFESSSVTILKVGL